MMFYFDLSLTKQYEIIIKSPCIEKLHECKFTLKYFIYSESGTYYVISSG